MTHVVKFSVTSTIEKFQTKEEFLAYDYKINNETYSEHQWDLTQREGLANNWIVDRGADFWDPNSQEFVSLVFCQDKESAEKFLELLYKSAYFHEAVGNAKKYGLFFTIKILEGSTATLSENFYNE
jgi:hypothetical protein